MTIKVVSEQTPLINAFRNFSSRGAVVSTEWLSQCLSYLASLGSISRATKPQTVVDTVLQILLDSDLHIAMDEVDLIPENIQVQPARMKIIF